MLIDCNIGGAVDGTPGGDADVIEQQARDAETLGFDGAWSTEVGRDPFLPLVLAARSTRRLTLGTGVAIAFARSPMTVATTAYDLQGLCEGRFVLGLGSQVKAHVTRRYGMPWSEPADRMREFLLALRAIWADWSGGAALDFRGEHYQHTLMTPMFRPARHAWAPPPVHLAAVGPRMTRVATGYADGVLLHSFSTVRHLTEHTLPAIEAGLEESERPREGFTVSFPAWSPPAPTTRSERSPSRACGRRSRSTARPPPTAPCSPRTAGRSCTSSSTGSRWRGSGRP